MKNFVIATLSSQAGKAVSEALSAQGKTRILETFEALKKEIRSCEFAFVDVEFLSKNATPEAEDIRETLQRLWTVNPLAGIIVMAPQQRVREAVNAVKAGASNYLTYPLVKEEVQYVLESLSASARLESELDYFRSHVSGVDLQNFARLSSPAMQEVYRKVKSIADTKTVTLLTGETGTGKGVIAKLIHRLSKRASGPFISVHCGAIPETLFESELFGHEKGAFTSADRRKMGKLELAAQGTVFLDEIGTIGPPQQVKLLHVLQEKYFQRVGGERDIPLKARFVAATNADLEKMAERGEFRKDLLYRLNVFPIEIPPLRQRPEDIRALADYFLKNLNALYGKGIHDFHPLVPEAMAGYSWPGNVRELENVIERAYLLESSHLLTPESFPSDLFRKSVSTAALAIDVSQHLADVRHRVADDAERSYLKELLRLHKGRIDRTAEHAGISTRQLRNLMSKHGLNKRDYKNGNM